MTQETICCPKCAHQQTNQIECEACGLLFRKFEQVRERERQAQTPAAGPAGSPEPASERASGPWLKFGSILVLVAATAAVTYWFAVGDKQLANHPPLAVRQESPEADRQPLQPQTRTAPPPQGFPTEQRPVEPVDGSVARGDAIEQAKQATVAIETPWGSVGSGFFITPTLVVTNRHVVEQDNKGLDELRHQIQTRRKMLALEQEQIDQLRKWIRTAPDGPGRRQAALAAQEKERNLAKLIPLQEEAEKRLRMMEETKNQLAIKIFLADGSEQYPQAIRTSPNRDLALITVYGGDGQPLKAAGGLTLREGDKVFTIGNPSGLRHTVTAGIFSGYRKDLDTGGVVLQTDAAINPGNSGGPLIDEQGRVHGVNYMIYRNTQGIGFAIPIQAVFDEFSLLP